MLTFGVQCAEIDQQTRRLMPVGKLVFNDRVKAQQVADLLAQRMSTRVVLKTRAGWIDPHELPFLIEDLKAIQDEYANPPKPLKKGPLTLTD